jgi:HPt (histidine-containing phosphotransfer) domain-containing protein
MNPKLAFLRERFAAGLTSRVAQMRECIETISQREDPQTEATLERLFHSLAGIGGTYGYQEITFLARAGEDACRLDDRRNRAARGALLHAIVDAIATASAGVASPASAHVA